MAIGMSQYTGAGSPPWKSWQEPRRPLALWALGIALVPAYLWVALTALFERLQGHMRMVQVSLVPSDFFLPWYAARALLAGRNPYTEEFALELHRVYYGATSFVLPSGAMPNVAAFSYPPYWIVSFLPFIGLPFEVARWASFGIFTVAIGGGTLLWLRALHVSWTRWGMGLAVLFSLIFFPSLELLYLQQPTGFIFIYLVGAYVAAAQGRYALAGILLGLATFKPQTAALPGAGLLFWSLWRLQRRPLPVAFAATMLGQLALAEFLLPGWIGHFLRAAGRYRDFNQTMFWLPQAITGSTMLGVALIAAPLLALLGYVWWRDRHEPASSTTWLQGAALTLTVAVALTPDVSLYNRALLVIPALTIIAALTTWRASRVRRSPLERTTTMIAYAGLAAPLVAVGSIAWASSLRLGISPAQVQSLLDVAQATYLALPLILLPALAGLVLTVKRTETPSLGKETYQWP